MALTSDEVQYIARLARVALSDAEVERYREELSSILGHLDALSRINTDRVPPTARSFDLVNVDREDEPRPSADIADVFLNAPRREGAYFRVRAVLD